MQPEGQDAASGTRTGEAGRQIIERLDQIASRLDRLGQTVEDLAILVAAGLTTRPPVLADSDLPLCPDGACPACRGTKVAIPEEPARGMVRTCAICGFAWRCAVEAENQVR